MSKEVIRVMVVDDNDGFRKSMELLIDSADGFTSAGSMDSAENIERSIEHMTPDVILMDIDMPAMSGIEGVKKVRATNPELPVLMLTAFGDDDHVFDSICAGATGYLLKSTEPQEILNSAKEVFNGGAPMSPSVARRVLAMFQSSNKKDPKPSIDLSDREREVLELLVKGLSYKMIAADLGVTYETVHSHIKKIYKTLHVNSATEAVSRALKDGLV